jgi:N-acetylneuraminate synthase
MVTVKHARVIAEIGCNHKGDFDIAKEMIGVAKHICNADSAKFQKRHNRELLGEAGYNAPHPNPDNSYGATYGQHRDFLEFTIDQHAELKAYCEQIGITYGTSVWDMTSAREVAGLHPEYIKIPSACNNHYPMLTWLCDNYEGEIHASVGMTTRDEVRRLVAFFQERGRAQDVVLYACTSGYPVPADDVCLLEIPWLIDQYGAAVKDVGFSGHHLGIAIDVAAYTLGAGHIERHFTLDRTWKGTDHAASLEPDGLRRLVRDLRVVERALTAKPDGILDIEVPQRDKLKYKG